MASRLTLDELILVRPQVEQRICNTIGRVLSKPKRLGCSPRDASVESCTLPEANWVKDISIGENP